MTAEIISRTAPRIDTTSPTAWARTWIDRVAFVFDGTTRPYEETDPLWYDLYIGDLPWTAPLVIQVCSAINADPRWAPLKARLIKSEQHLSARKRHNWTIY